ncbi:MAG TPA: hypothetical protein VNF47_17940 [Streptosporangiaceae bacterium]|nr:hypothetical protein [Streptosporangiaceae bacterium]
MPPGVPNEPRRGSEPATEDLPLLPSQSQEDTDVGWGERPTTDDDERLRGDRPPHWDVS